LIHSERVKSSYHGEKRFKIGEVVRELEQKFVILKIETLTPNGLPLNKMVVRNKAQRPFIILYMSEVNKTGRVKNQFCGDAFLE